MMRHIHLVRLIRALELVIMVMPHVLVSMRLKYLIVLKVVRFALRIKDWERVYMN